MKRYIILTLALIILMQSVAWADTTFKHFKKTGEINVNNQSDFIILELSPEVLGSTGTMLKDFRLYNELEELAYLKLSNDRQYSSKAEKSTPIEVNYFITENASDKTTEILIDNQFENFYSENIIIETSDKNFNRQVRIEGSNDKNNWDLLSRDFIYQDSAGQKLDLSYLPVGYRYLRLTILNKDNQPLNIADIKLRPTPFQLLVNTTGQPGVFTLKAYWGDSSLNAPQYDLENLNVSSDPWEDYPTVILDSFEKNKDFVEEDKPITEQIPWLMPLSLSVLVIIAVGFLYKTVRAIR